MIMSRYRHTATLLPNGKVLVAGGDHFPSGPVSIAELYDPATGVWTGTGRAITGRENHTATLLSNGKVLVVGGRGGLSGRPLSSAELYDPSAGTWIDAGTLAQARELHTATLLSNRKVLVAGGEYYDPIAGFYPTTSSAELFDADLGFAKSSQPKFTSGSWLLNLGGSLIITGAQFRGISEGSGGNGAADSPADYPLVQLRSIESGQTTFLLSTNWSTNSFASVPVWNFPAGYALVTVFVNGVPSASSIVNISVPVPTAMIITSAKKLANGSFQVVFTNTPGAIFGALASTNLSLALSNWTALGGVAEISPGQFQFTDPQATSSTRRFYRIRSM
jgi:hypothetical protein